MTDEKFVFVTDVADKKNIARSSHNRKTHAGKGGAVKFPSDYLSKKELRAMNGEVKTYRMNDPLTWKEFKEMPDDIRVLYIKALRNKYNVANAQISEMMGVHKVTFANEIARLGIKEGQRKGKTDTEGFLAWWHGVPVCKEEPKEEVEELLKPVPVIDLKPVKEAAIPTSGTMTFCSCADDALDAVKTLLGGKYLKVTVSWEHFVEGVNECGK